MSNLNIPKEYYINFPIKYLGTKARIETRYKINYIPSENNENLGDYEITLQLKGTWLLERDPIAVSDFLEEIYADEFCYDLYANAEVGQSSIELIIPFLDTKLKASLESSVNTEEINGKQQPINKKITFGLYNEEVLNFALVNEKWLDFPLPSTTEGSGDDVVYWKKQIDFPKYKERIPFIQGTGGMDIEFKNNKIIFKNIIQTNKPLTIKSNLILRAYDSALPVNDEELMSRMYFRDDEQSLPTLNLEDTIGNFSVINPNNTTIDYYGYGSLTKPFLAKINAQKINSFCMNIYNDKYELIYSSGWVSGSTEVVPNVPDGEDVPVIPVYNILGEVIGKFSKTTGQFNYNSVIISNSGEGRDLIFHYPNKNYLYNNEILEYEIFSGLNLDEIFSQTSTKRLYYNFNLSKYSVQEAYQKPFYTTKDYVIELAKPIESELYLENIKLEPQTILNNTINKFTGTYFQENDIPIDYYSFYLYDEYQNLVDSKEEVYSENIFYEYDAFEFGKEYLLEFFIRNKNGQTFKRNYTLVNNFQDLIEETGIEVLINSSKKNNGVAILIKDLYATLENLISALVTLKGTGSLNILRKEEKSNVSKNIFSSNLNMETLNLLKVSNSFIENHFEGIKISSCPQYGIIDYSAKNNKNYTYSISVFIDIPEDAPITEGYEKYLGKHLLFKLDKSIMTHWDNYIIYPLLRTDKNYKLSLDDQNNVIGWKFSLNCEEADIILNQDKTIFTTFSEKPKVILGNLNYHSGSLKCLLGDFIENNSYYEPSSLLDSWEKFLLESSCGLFKNPKGDAFIVFVENNSARSYMNEIANEYLYDGELSVKPTTISFNYIEIDRINEKLYIQLGD